MHSTTRIALAALAAIVLSARPLLLALTPGLDEGPSKPRILVGPNVLVSRDGDYPHVELMVAANPRNPKNLIGGAITATRRGGGTATTPYASFDGGYTWVSTAFPSQLDHGGGDPQVAFSMHGTGLFTSLAHVQDDTGRTRAALHVFRSEDGGRSWSQPIDLGYSYDHEQIVVDRTLGKAAGRIYLGALWGYPVYRIGVFRSDDDGRTWVGPVEAANGGGELGINVVNMLVLSDGTLFVPFCDFEFKPERRAVNSSSAFWFVTSADGGVTFSSSRKIVTASRDKPPQGRFQSFPLYAVDARSDRFRDRLYMAWNDVAGGRARVLFSHSKDRGQTWSAAATIAAGTTDADQYQPMLAVNEQGTVGVTWFDTRGSTDGAYHEYFTASVDGGETFLPEVRVSTEASLPAGPGNLTLTPSDFRTADSWRINLLNAAGRWGNGGDYMGLTTDAAGIFHPFWADSRSGTFQIWTARVEVKQPPAAPAAASSAATPAPAQPDRFTTSLGTRVELVYDPTRYDTATKTAQLPIRIRNVSDRPIFGPITIEVLKFGSGLTDEGKENAPVLVNATNGKPGDGATFDYSKALGDLESLEPGALTEAVVWKMRLVDPLRSPNIHIRATGTVER